MEKRKQGQGPSAVVPSVSVRVAKKIHKRLKVYAAHNDMEIREVVDAAVDHYLNRKKRGA